MGIVQLDPWVEELIGELTMSARKIRPSRYGVTGYKMTDKALEPQEAESSLEHDFLTLLEFDRRVERYLSQPFKIEWRDANERQRTYTPDVIVKYGYWAKEVDPALTATIFEVKYTEDLKKDWNELKPKLRAAIGWARDHGCRFHLITEKQIRTPYLLNAKFLLRYRSKYLNGNSDVAGERQHLILKTLRELQQTTPKGLLAHISLDKEFQGELIPWMWNLVIQDLIGVNLSEKLTMSSPIWILPSTKNALKVWE